MQVNFSKKKNKETLTRFLFYFQELVFRLVKRTVHFELNLYNIIWRNGEFCVYTYTCSSFFVRPSNGDKMDKYICINVTNLFVVPPLICLESELKCSVANFYAIFSTARGKITLVKQQCFRWKYCYARICKYNVQFEFSYKDLWNNYTGLQEF